MYKKRFYSVIIMSVLLAGCTLKEKAINSNTGKTDETFLVSKDSGSLASSLKPVPNPCREEEIPLQDLFGNSDFPCPEGYTVSAIKQYDGDDQLFEYNVFLEAEEERILVILSPGGSADWVYKNGKISNLGDYKFAEYEREEDCSDFAIDFDTYGCVIRTINTSRDISMEILQYLIDHPIL